MNPLLCPDVDVRHAWDGPDLYWLFPHAVISDEIVRSWCKLNLDYPWNKQVDHGVKRYHLNAWAEGNK